VPFHVNKCNRDATFLRSVTKHLKNSALSGPASTLDKVIRLGHELIDEAEPRLNEPVEKLSIVSI
jgi:hypothetical protein